MGLSGTVFIQVVIMSILIFVGFILTKTNVINEKGTRQMTDILLKVVTPCVLISAYQKDFSIDLAGGLLISALFAVIIHIVAILIATVIFKKEESLRYRVSIFASVYSNCGFMAIPLLSATMGADGVFYGSAYLAVFTLFYWTHGICLYGGSINEISLKNIITNPGIIGTVIAVVLFVFNIRLPYVLGESVKYFAGLNTPLAMVVMGSYLTQVSFNVAIKNKGMYAVSFLRLIVIPVIVVLIAKLFIGDDVIAKAILISAACPTAAVSTLLAAKYGLNTVYASEIVSITTILSIVTIPLILMLY